jgi:D-amino-acid dehydrogenase
MQTFDVIVLGAGIAGVSTARHLQQRGQRVALIDRRGAGEETSYGNAGIIEASFVLPFGFPSPKRFKDILFDNDASARVDLLFLPRMLKWLWDFYGQSSAENRSKNGLLMRPLVENAVAEHQALMHGTDAEKYFCKTGRIKIHRTQQSFDNDVFERDTLKKLNVPFDVLDAVELSKLEPHLKPIYYKALKLNSSARVTDPGAAVAAYAARFVRDGGAFITGDGGTLKQLNDGAWQVDDCTAPQVVVALGPWAPRLLKPMGYHFPIGLKRGYHQHFKTTDGATLNHAIVDGDVGYLMGSFTKGLRITTGAEFAAQDAPPNPVQIARVLPFARELFPVEGVAEETAWLGSRPCTIDSLPIVGTAARHKGLWFNIGHGHSGFTIGPSTGRLLAQMMVGEKTFTDPAPYRPERF